MISVGANLEIAEILCDRPLAAIELGLMSEEDFIELMRSVHRKLKMQAMVSLAGIDTRTRMSFADILEAARRVSIDGY
jgi:hypothetical protein